MNPEIYFCLSCKGYEYPCIYIIQKNDNFKYQVQQCPRKLDGCKWFSFEQFLEKFNLFRDIIKKELEVDPKLLEEMGY